MKKFIALVIFLALTVIFIPWLHPARAADQKVDVYENQKLVRSVVFKIGLKKSLKMLRTKGYNIIKY